MVTFIGRALVRLGWLLLPHGFRSSGQFSSGICGRCGKERTAWHAW